MTRTFTVNWCEKMSLRPKTDRKRQLGRACIAGRQLCDRLESVKFARLVSNALWCFVVVTRHSRYWLIKSRVPQIRHRHRFSSLFSILPLYPRRLRYIETFCIDQISSTLREREKERERERAILEAANEKLGGNLNGYRSSGYSSMEATWKCMKTYHNYKLLIELRWSTIKSAYLKANLLI